MFDSPFDFFSLVIAIVAFIDGDIGIIGGRGQADAAATPRAGSADRAIGSGPDQN